MMYDDKVFASLCRQKLAEIGLAYFCHRSGRHTGFHRQKLNSGTTEEITEKKTDIAYLLNCEYGQDVILVHGCCFVIL